MKLWLIWSHEHRAWWAPDRHGYTTERQAAGHYEFDEALEIVKQANRHPRLINTPEESMVPA